MQVRWSIERLAHRVAEHDRDEEEPCDTGRELRANAEGQGDAGRELEERVRYAGDPGTVTKRRRGAATARCTDDSLRRCRVAGLDSLYPRPPEAEPAGLRED